MPPRLILRTAIGDYPHVRALRDGRVTSPRVGFAFVTVAPISRAFRPMARELAFDLSEMAVATLAQAHARAVQIVGLAAVLMRGFHHGALVCRRDGPIAGPEDLPGRRIGVRAFSQTTGVWVRGILAGEHGIDPARITWVTTEDAHVADCPDPPWVERAAPGTDLARDLAAGGLDAGVALAGLDPAATRPVIADPAAAAGAWYRRTGIYPVNHALALRAALHAEHPWLAGELMALFAAARDAAPPPPHPLVGADALPYGLPANRAAIETLTGYAAAQGLIPAAYRATDLFVA
jgi:4,5-dihydroxyphthalate decarboxylase